MIHGRLANPGVPTTETCQLQIGGQHIVRSSNAFPPVRPVRVWPALFALAFGAFGIGAAEFVALGLMPELAMGLVPEVQAVSPERAIAQAGWLATAYALGVVVGAPTLGVVAGRWPRRRVLVVLLGVAAAATFASAVLPSLELVLAARFVSALPHGAYFGVASLMAGSLLGPGKRGRGIALVLSGLTAATLAGVPLLTWLGQVAGWRAAFTLVGVLFLAALIAVAVLTPAQPGDPAATLGRQLGAFRRGAVWLALATAAIGFGGFFAVYTYVATFVTETAQAGPGWVPAALAALGAGMVIGNPLGGWLSDRSMRLALFGGFASLIAALLLVVVLSGTLAGVLIGVFLVGVTAMSLSPTLQARLLDVMGESPTLAGALNQSAINLGNGLGAYIGGAVIAAGFGYIAPAWAGVVLAAAAVVLGLIGFTLEHRHRRTTRPSWTLTSEHLPGAENVEKEPAR